MPILRLVSIAGLILGACPGCITGLTGKTGGACPPPAECPDGSTIRVKAPPQKIFIEQPECAPAAEGCKAKPEAAPEKKEERPESAKQPEAEKRERRPEPEAGRQEGALGTLSSLGQVASLTRTVAMTRSLGTVNPGASALGLGIRWIHIPIPIPRLFSVEETPSITVPLSEANLTAVGGFAGGNGGRGLTKDEIAALVAQEMAAQRAQRQEAQRQEAAPPCPASDTEQRRMEKKLADAEAQIEKLSNILKSLDEKLPAKRPGN
jgi:hypothetical protein